MHRLKYRITKFGCGNTWDGGVLGVSHAAAYWTKASRGLSAIAEFLVLYCKTPVSLMQKVTLTDVFIDDCAESCS